MVDDATELIDGAALNSGQRLDKADQTHLVLASGKLVQQKMQKLVKAPHQFGQDFKRKKTQRDCSYSDDRTRLA